ncbi:hypothetical protein [Elizabethkingia anophelis]|uniref:hypothetical protein n=1 Tax=Elizabethkingia anophelis TaxID=1117645 RepID=UPI001316A932|nr:hypothetical protein [Elizabethkingia anophelis]BBQ07936.1 hypothetical protein JUNP353_2507 [Elizabethkingia anophelis]
MSKTFKNVFAKAALAIFAAHKNLYEIYVTSDEQGFTDPDKAADRSRYLKNDRVEHFKRGFEDNYTEPEETDSLDANTDIEPGTTEAQKTEQTTETENKADSLNTGDGIEPAAAEKNALISQYKELYGVAPAHNIGLGTLKAKIAEKAPGQNTAATDADKDQEKDKDKPEA